MSATWTSRAPSAVTEQVVRPAGPATLGLFERLILGLGVVASTLVGWAAGFAATLEVSPLRILLAGVGFAALPILLLHLELGTLVFLGLLWSRVSDVAIAFHGVPALALPFGALLITTSFIRKFLRDEPIGLPTFRDLYPAAPYVLVVLLSAIWAPYPQRVFVFAFGLVKDIFVFWIIADTLRSRLAIKRALLVLVVAAGLLSLISLHQYFTGNFGSRYGGFAQSEVLNIVGEVNSNRLGGPLNSPNPFAHILVVTVPMGLALLRTRLHPFVRLATAGLLVAISLTILLTFSRGFALVLALVVALSLPRHRIGAPQLLAAALLVAVTAVALPPTVWERIETLASPFIDAGESSATVDAAVELRLGAQLAGVEMFYASPFVGVGAGNFPPLYQDYSRGLGLRTIAREFGPHNQYLEILAENGMLGLFAFCLIFLIPMFKLRRAYPDDRPGDPATHDWRELLYGLEIAMIGYLAGMTMLHGSYPRYFWMLLALIVAAARIPRYAESVDR